MEAASSTSKSSDTAAGPKKQARLAGPPPALPTKGPSNIDDPDDDASDAESDFDESTIKSEGGLVSKLEDLDERTFKDKYKVALREIENGENGEQGEDGEDEETSNAAKELTDSKTSVVNPLVFLGRGVNNIGKGATEVGKGIGRSAEMATRSFATGFNQLTNTITAIPGSKRTSSFHMEGGPATPRKSGNAGGLASPL